MGRKSRAKREWRKRYGGGWKEYWRSQKTSSWSFTDGLAAFTIPEGTSILGGVLLYAVAFVLAALFDTVRLCGRRPVRD